MMNGEGPSVPITTLAGIQSLTDLLLELPLPAPLSGYAGNKSLLCHGRDREDALRVINAPDGYLIPQLIEALSHTSTDHVEVKDGYAGIPPHGGQNSQLVQYLLSRNPALFKTAATSQVNSSSPCHPPANQWMQPRYPPGVLFPQAAYSPAALSVCSPHPNSPQFSATQSPGYFGVDTGPAIRQHPTSCSPVSQQRSPLGYSPYSQSLANQHAPAAHQNNITQCDPNGLNQSNIADGKFYPNAATPSNVPLLRGNMCVDGAIAKADKLRTERFPAGQQKHPLNSNVPYSSPALANQAADALPGSSTSLDNIHLTSLTPPPSATHILDANDFQVNKGLDVQNSTSCTNANNFLQNACDSILTPQDTSSDCMEKMDISKDDGIDINVKQQTPAKIQKPTAGPVVILNKLSQRDQALAQKSVREFTRRTSAEADDIKDDKTPVTRNRSTAVSRRDNRRRSSGSDEVDWMDRLSSPKKKAKERQSTSKDSRNQKRQLKDDDDFDYVPEDDPSVFTASLTERVKKRRRQTTHQSSKHTDSGNEASDKGDDASDNELVSFSKKFKKKKSRQEMKEEQLSMEDVMDSNTYQRFSRTVDSLFDTMEDVDLTAELDEDAECPVEALIPHFQLKDLCNESAKLKMLQAMNQFPTERLVRLLSILERNVLDGSKLSPIQMLEDQDEEESKLWLEATMERVMRSADASLACLYVMTSPKMPEKVFLEEVIDRIVLFAKFHLQNTVYPVFDPAYRVNRRSKDGYVGNIKQKRAHSGKVKERSVIQLYNKLHEVVGLLAELLTLQTFTDTTILQVSTLGVGPFFVEGVSELQLSSLRLVTGVFSRYEKHRQLILEDILASIARLPTSKRSLRNYRLNSEENIQMLAALVLQLIQSVVRLPEFENEEPEKKADTPTKEKDKKDKPKADAAAAKDSQFVDKGVLITTSYEAAVRTALNFLSVFLKKCGTKHEEMDYRPLFENFVQDLLSTVNKPEWPASELLLSLLGRLLVQNFSNKSIDMALRVASLDYLGVVAARLRKDAVSSQSNQDSINEVIKTIKEEAADEESLHYKSKKHKHKNKPVPPKPDDTQILQKALLDYLAENMQTDSSLTFARSFYIAQWFRDAALEIKISQKTFKKDKKESPPIPPKTSGAKSNRPSRNKGRRVSSTEQDEEDEIEIEKDETKSEPSAEESNAQILAQAEVRKKYLLSVMLCKTPTAFKQDKEKHSLDYNTAELISKFLASRRPFSQSFDTYLSHILRVLHETAVAVRTKAMKCLTLVVESDPGILARRDMQQGVHARLLDQSTSVREAAVDLVGKFILIRPDLTEKYYDMIMERILDTGVSVRKRVIKILKEVCVEQPDFPKIPEICVKMIRRVNDEEGIKKLVSEVFQSMWFTPVKNKNEELILLKVKNITHVVAACKDIGFEWFEQLLSGLLKNSEDPSYATVLRACKQIVDCLVENVLQLEESSGSEATGASESLVGCLTTLYLFSKIKPHLVVPHAITIQPYLSMKCVTTTDYLVLQNVAKTLELVIPLMDHPSESFLAQVEEDVVKLILRYGISILSSCVSCLGAVVNRVTRNYKFVRDCFQKFLVVLLGYQKEHEMNPNNPLLKLQRPRLLRSLYTVGLFCKEFDFNAIEQLTDSQEPIKERVFNVIMYFTRHEEVDIRHKALMGLGFMMIRHYEYMLGIEVKGLYHGLLNNPTESPTMKCQVLKNITLYLLEEEARMIQKDAEWNKVSKQEDLKEMGDISSGMGSTVIQLYLKPCLEAVFHSSVSVRKVALHVVQLIQSQGLVHPVQMVPNLICMGSDDDKVIRTKADQLLQDIEKKYPGFVQMKALSGVRMSYKMQQVLNEGNSSLIRGYRVADYPASRNGFLYTVVRTTRQSRRAHLLSLLKQYDEQARTSLLELLYLADNIVYYPFQVQDEPLFVMHHIDIILSVSGSNLLQSFREALIPKNINAEGAPAPEEDDDDDDIDGILERMPEDTSILHKYTSASQGCVLLLYVKQTLKEMYGFTDNKIQQYSPTETAKIYEKALNRRSGVRFKPTSILEYLDCDDSGTDELDPDGVRRMVEQYLSFKQLMLTIDPADEDEDNETGGSNPIAKMLQTQTPNVSASEAVVNHTPGTSEGATTVPKVDKKLLFTPKIKNSNLNGSSSGRSRRPRSKSPRGSTTPKDKDKLKKRGRKKRRRILASDDSEDGESDPDYQ